MFPFSKLIIVCWLIFWLCWIIWAFKSKKSINSNVKHFFGIRIIILALALILFRFINKQTFENRLVTNNELVLTVGFIIFLLGLLLAIWARLNLAENWGMPMTQKQTPELVTSGPYRYVRHPIYSGILLAALGSVIAGSLYWLLIFIIYAVYFIYSAVIEERFMMKQFPKVYPEYKSKTKMLIPSIF